MTTPRATVTQMRRKWILLVISAPSLCSCHESTAPPPTPAGVYVLRSVVIPAGDTIAIPGQLPRSGSNDTWIVSGSITLDELGNYQFVQRDSINCVTCDPSPAYSIETLVSSGWYRIADTVVTFSDLVGTSSLRNGVIRVPGLAYGTEEFQDAGTHR